MSEAEAVDLAAKIRERAGASANEDDRPVIKIRNELTEVTDEAIDALGARPDLGVYVRTGKLVQVIRDGVPRKKWLSRAPGAPVISELSKAQALAKVDQAASWRKFNKREKGLVQARPPGWVAEQVLARAVWPLPYLEAVVETPTIRRDGSLLETPGYDEATGLLYEPGPGAGVWPGVPESSKPEEVRRAVNTLLDPVTDFPFVTDADRAAYVAAVLSLLGRHLISGPVPMFPVRAPTPGTGKGLLVSVMVTIGTGRPSSVMQMAKAAELRKRITALALAGDPCVLLDDVSGNLSSSVLASALTATEWQDRILGVNETVRVPLHLVWFATGNNLGFGRTLGRRVVPIDLDSGLETPEDRTGFRHPKLLHHVEKERLKLVAAALTILRGFALAGKPQHGGPPMGSYEDWDHQVRSAVIWAGMEDPASTEDASKGRGRIRASADDDLDRLAMLLATLYRAFGADRFLTSEAIQKAKDKESLMQDLELAAASRKTGKVTSYSLGAALRDATDRPVGEFTLRSDTGKRPRRWWVERR